MKSSTRQRRVHRFLSYLLPVIIAVPLVIAILLLSGHFAQPVADMISLAVKMGVTP